MKNAPEVMMPASPERRAFSRSVLAAAVAGAGAAVIPKRARAAEFKIKYGNDAPYTHSINVRGREAAERIRKETNGAVQIQIFPNSQLGGDPEMFSQVRSGAIQMYSLPGMLAQTVVPDSGIHSVAFAFKDYPAVWAAQDGDLGAHIRKSMASAGVHALGKAWDNGFRQITSRDKPIRSPADLAGFKIRTPAFPMIVNIFEGLGASPTAINIKETYAALQTRLVDGQENAMLLLEVFKFHEVQKFCAITNHVWDGMWMSFNMKYWESLPADVRLVIEKHFNDSALQERDDVAAQDRRMVTEMTKKGVTFSTPELTPFREALRKSGYYDKWRKEFTPQGWELLERYAGRLT